jgi:NAD(P)-dependent dehydrogenase (short-subunit alcohol dehydrogenase family)
MESNGRFALVTGGGSGIDRAAALALHSAGYAVAIAGRRLAELEKTVAMADSARKMIAVQADVSKPDYVNALFAGVKQEFAPARRVVQ